MDNWSVHGGMSVAVMMVVVNGAMLGSAGWRVAPVIEL